MQDMRGRQDLLSVSSAQRGGTVHLRIAGEIDLATAPTLEGSLRAAERNDIIAIVLDLGDVTFMDASGVRAFICAAKRARESGRTFAIARAPERVQRVLRITGATHLLAAGARAPLSERPSTFPRGFSIWKTAAGPTCALPESEPKDARQ